MVVDFCSTEFQYFFAGDHHHERAAAVEPQRIALHCNGAH